MLFFLDFQNLMGAKSNSHGSPTYYKKFNEMHYTSHSMLQPILHKNYSQYYLDMCSETAKDVMSMREID